MRYDWRPLALAGIAVLGGCATGPVYQARPWQSSVRACIGRVCSYAIGMTSESAFCADWIPPMQESQAHAACLINGQIVGYFDQQSHRTAGHSETTYWVGYYESVPYSYRRDEVRLYALTFSDGVLASIYEP